MRVQSTRDRRKAILVHLARYRLSLIPILERLFFDGQRSDNVLSSMRKKGLIASDQDTDERRAALPGGYTYYQLGKQGVRFLKDAGVPDVSPDWAKPVPPNSFEKHLALLWFCCVGEKRANLLTAANLQTLLGNRPEGDKGDYCLQLTSPQQLIRPVVVTPATADDTYLERFRRDLDHFFAHNELDRWLLARRLKYVFLVPEENRGKRLRDQLKKPGYLNTLDIRYAVVPTVQTLHDALAKLKEAPCSAP